MSVIFHSKVDNLTLEKPSRKFARHLAENIQRKDLTPIDKALALLGYKEMLRYDGTRADVEKRLELENLEENNLCHSSNYLKKPNRK